jgi:hypothetical protein
VPVTPRNNPPQFTPASRTAQQTPSHLRNVMPAPKRVEANSGRPFRLPLLPSNPPPARDAVQPAGAIDKNLGIGARIAGLFTRGFSRAPTTENRSTSAFIKVEEEPLNVPSGAGSNPLYVGDGENDKDGHNNQGGGDGGEDPERPSPRPYFNSPSPTFSLVAVDSPNHSYRPPSPEPQTDALVFYGFVPETCPDDTIRLDPDLEKFSLCVNKRFRALICLACRYMVLPQNMRGHLMRTHNYKGKEVPAGFGERVQRKYGLVMKLPSVSERIKPIFGLETVKAMHCCPECFRGYSEKRYFIEHLRTLHGGTKYTPFISPAQRLTPQGNSSYFPVIVEPVIAVPKPRGTLETLLGQHTRTDISSEPMEFTKDSHLLSRFLTRSKWTEVVEGLIPKWVRAYVGVATNDEEELKPLSQYTEEWLAETQEIISAQPQPLLNAISAYKT